MQGGPDFDDGNDRLDHAGEGAQVLFARNVGWFCDVISANRAAPQNGARVGLRREGHRRNPSVELRWDRSNRGRIVISTKAVMPCDIRQGLALHLTSRQVVETYERRRFTADARPTVRLNARTGGSELQPKQERRQSGGLESPRSRLQTMIHIVIGTDRKRAGAEIYQPGELQDLADV
ncbi:hypothetical protein [Bradyrhizobium sp. 23]|uniref:hypothetical protein n=1 Tax=Bradyrhizobium sp. 23 TaxID=2782667 RepID=UPI001FFC0FEE|nr:hypothetical protein [Bradyrhizobium sp. 23]